MLSSFEPADIARIAKSIAPSLYRYTQLSADTIVQDTLAAKERGFAVSRGRVFSEVGSASASSCRRQPRDDSLSSIAAPASIMNADTIAQLAATMRTTIDAAIQQLKTSGGCK